MAYNFVCETASEPDWQKLNAEIRKYNKLQSFPMLEAEEGKWALAVSIPMNNAGKETLSQFEEAFKILTEEYGFKIYDMYYGCLVTTAHFGKLRKEIG